MRKIISREDAIAAGLVHYYTGVPCRNGHKSPRYVNEWDECVTCTRRSAKKAYAKKKALEAIAAMKSKKRIVVAAKDAKKPLPLANGKKIRVAGPKKDRRKVKAITIHYT